MCVPDSYSIKLVQCVQLHYGDITDFKHVHNVVYIN